MLESYGILVPLGGARGAVDFFVARMLYTLVMALLSCS